MDELTQEEPQPLWIDIRGSFLRAIELCDEAQARQEEFEARQEELNPLTGQMGTEPSFEGTGPAGGVDMVVLRESIRKLLGSLRKRLSRELSEREVYFVLFPIVIYIDELVQLRLTSVASPWQPLQRELYKIDNGGERFYEGIDNLLSKSDTDSIIFEVFYFCLSHGFRGRYVNDPEKVKFYRSLLSQRIPTRHLVSGNPDKRVAPARIHLVAFPKWIYAAALGTGILGLICAYLASSLELHI